MYLIIYEYLYHAVAFESHETELYTYRPENRILKMTIEGQVSGKPMRSHVSKCNNVSLTSKGSKDIVTEITENRSFRPSHCRLGRLTEAQNARK